MKPVSLYAGPIEFLLSWQSEVAPVDLDSRFTAIYRRKEAEPIWTTSIEIANPVARLSSAPADAKELPRNWRVWRVPAELAGSERSSSNTELVLQIYAGFTGAYELEARVSADFRSVRLVCRDSNPRKNLLEFLLATLTRWLAAHIAASHGGFLLHCAAIGLPDGSVIVGTAPSGTGKSTFSGFYSKKPGYRVLTDETCLVMGDRAGFKAYGTPWHGMFVTGSNAGGPIHTAFFLEQAPSHAIRELPLSEAGLRLVREIFLPPWSPELTAATLDSALRFLAVTPYRALGFKKSKTIVDYLEERL